MLGSVRSARAAVSPRRLASALVLAASVFAVSLPAAAAEFSLGGYYRLRMELFKSLSANVGLDNVPNGDTTGYWQHRVRLDPKVKLNDNVAFYAQIDLLDNVIAGDYPEIDTAYGNALAEFFSQAALPEHDADSTGIVGDSRRNIAVKRAWAEVLTGIGQLKFGRMGSHWGLGILANDGNDWDSDYGDTVDRIMFITKAGPIYIVPMVDKVAESALYSSGSGRAVDIGTNPASLSNPNDDVDEFVLVGVYRGELSSGGVYGVFRYQPATQAQVYIGDGWGKTKIGPVNVEAEGVYLHGKIANFIPPNVPAHLTATQWGFAAETSVPTRHFIAGLNFGAASGDDASGPTNGTLNNFFFDRDYHVAFLLFRYVMPLDAPPAVSNAVYVKPNVRVDLSDNFTLDGGVVYAKTLTASPTYGTGNYGTEVDLGATWRLYENFEAGVRYGLLMPGDALKPTTATTKLDSLVHGLEGRFLVRF